MCRHTNSPLPNKHTQTHMHKHKQESAFTVNEQSNMFDCCLIINIPHPPSPHIHTHTALGLTLIRFCNLPEILYDNSSSPWAADSSGCGRYRVQECVCLRVLISTMSTVWEEEEWAVPGDAREKEGVHYFWSQQSRGSQWGDPLRAPLIRWHWRKKEGVCLCVCLCVCACSGVLLCVRV